MKKPKKKKQSPDFFHQSICSNTSSNYTRRQGANFQNSPACWVGFAQHNKSFRLAFHFAKAQTESCRTREISIPKKRKYRLFNLHTSSSRDNKTKNKVVGSIRQDCGYCFYIYSNNFPFLFFFNFFSNWSNVAKKSCKV